MSFPALPASGVPWVRIVSCNPAELKDPDVPPTFSGYPAGDRSDWTEYRAEYRRTLARPARGLRRVLPRARRARPARPRVRAHEPAPEPLRCIPTRSTTRARGRSTARGTTSQASVRETDAPWEPPEGDGPLIYLSLGSLGSGDVELMRTLIGALADTRHRVVVSKGPQHDQLELPGNMTGAEFLPQVSILPHVDARDHARRQQHRHRVAALRQARWCMLPLFWDQYDNAQRIARDRLRRCGSTPTARARRSSPARSTACSPTPRCATGWPPLSARLAATPGTVTAADLIERLAADAPRDHQ